MTARLADGVTTEVLHEALHAAYADEPFVFLLPEDQWPATKSVIGSNSVHLQVTLNIQFSGCGRIRIGSRSRPNPGR